MFRDLCSDTMMVKSTSLNRKIHWRLTFSHQNFKFQRLDRIYLKFNLREPINHEKKVPFNCVHFAFSQIFVLSAIGVLMNNVISLE